MSVVRAPWKLGLLAQLQGMPLSTTRAELCAALIGIYGDEPVHIGTDSKAFFDKANSLLCIAQQREMEALNNGFTSAEAIAQTLAYLPLGKHWGRTTDGDLWHAFWRGIVAKGFYGVRLTKIKSHLGTEAIEQGLISSEHYWGNEYADQLAKKGADANHRVVTSMALFVEKRLEAYRAFMDRVQKYIVAVYRAERHRLD